jgi:hypothetical protein
MRACSRLGRDLVLRLLIDRIAQQGVFDLSDVDIAELVDEIAARVGDYGLVGQIGVRLTYI